MIVAPVSLSQSTLSHYSLNSLNRQCVRCTSSISANNRATNGHRFVFHSSEVIGTERHYVKGENGVNPIEPPQMIINTPTVPSMQSSTPGYSSQYPPSNLPPYSPRPSETPRERQSSSIARSDYLPTPPLEFASTAFLTSRYEYPGHDTAPVRPDICSHLCTNNQLILPSRNHTLQTYHLGDLAPFRLSALLNLNSPHSRPPILET